MPITKKIIAPLIIVIILSGAAGIMSAREATYQRMQDIKHINVDKQKHLELPDKAGSSKPLEATRDPQR